MPDFTFERAARTPTSDAFVIHADGAPIGRVDLHYGADLAHATICVPDDFSEDAIQELLSEVDERLVMTAQPFREDFVAAVWLGRQAGIYSEEGEDELEDDVEGNGRLD